MIVQVIPNTTFFEHGLSNNPDYVKSCLETKQARHFKYRILSLAARIAPHIPITCAKRNKKWRLLKCRKPFLHLTRNSIFTACARNFPALGQHNIRLVFRKVSGTIWEPTSIAGGGSTHAPENLMRICALFSCSPRGLSSWASSLQSALTAASGVGYNLKNSHSTGLAALPRQQLNHGSERGKVEA